MTGNGIVKGYEIINLCSFTMKMKTPKLLIANELVV